MKYLNLVNIVFLLLSASIASAVRTERLYGKAEDGTERALKKAKCPHKDQEHKDNFNAAFFLEDPEYEALCDCTDAEMIMIGDILRDCTKQVDEKFPEYVPEVLEVDTEVCIVPCVWQEDNATDTDHRQLGRRRKRYTYVSGGTCRRCATSRRRLAVDTFKELQGRRSLGEDSTPDEMATEACDFAEVSQLAYVECEDVVKQIGDSLENMLEDSTDKDYLKKCSEAEKIAAEMIDKLEETGEYAMDAADACIEAKEMAEKGDKKKSEECLKDAEKAADKIMEGLKKVKEGQEKAKKKQMEAKKVLLKQEKEVTEERSSRAIEHMERKMEKLKEELEKKIERAKDSGHGKEHLEKLKQEAEVQITLLEYEQKRFEQQQEDEEKFNEELASLLLEAEFAKDYEAWMDAYQECLQIVTLYELTNNFSQDTETAGGCIRKYKRNDNGVVTNKETKFEVKVTFDIKESKRDTLEDTCKVTDVKDLKDDLPCEDCDGEPDWVP